MTKAPLNNPIKMSETKKEYEVLKLTNVRVKYAKVIRPGKAYDDSHPDEWSVNMYVTDEDRDALMARGANPKEDKEGNEYWMAKRGTVTRNSKAQKPPTVVDAAKRPFTEDIGNGSVCNIVVTLIPWEKAKRKGIKLFLNAVQVVNHVAFRNSDEDYFDELEPADDGTDLL